jgi:hypothetical protein
VKARLDEELAKDGPLSPWATRHGAARYMKIHLSAADADEAHTLADRLGWKKLGEGLQPVG